MKDAMTEQPNQLLAETAEWARELKTNLVATTTPDQIDDICPAVAVFRDGELVARVHAWEVNRDVGLRALLAAVSGFRADYAVMVQDAHMSSHHTKPDGTPWGPNEMQRLCDDEGACEIGYITDCLTLLGRARTETDPLVEGISLPYHVHKTARSVAWQEDHHTNNAGLLAETMHEAFAKPVPSREFMRKVWTLTEGPDVDVDEHLLDLHTDLGQVRALMTFGFRVEIFFGRSDEDQEIIDASVAQHKADPDKILRELLEKIRA